MKGRWLLAANLLAAAAAVLVLAVAWFYLPRESFAWAVVMAFLVQALAAYLDIRATVSAALFRGKRPAADGAGRRARLLLGGINVLAALLIFLILAFAWLYLRDQMLWAVLGASFILAAVIGLNILMLGWDYIRARARVA